MKFLGFVLWSSLRPFLLTHPNLVSVCWYMLVFFQTTRLGLVIETAPPTSDMYLQYLPWLPLLAWNWLPCCRLGMFPGCLRMVAGCMRIVAGCLRIVTQSLDCWLVTGTQSREVQIAHISIIVLSHLWSRRTVLALLMYLMHTKFLVKLS